MLVTREDISKKVSRHLREIFFDKEKKKIFTDYLYNEKEIPTGAAIDVLSERISLTQVDDFTLYSICECLTNVFEKDFIDKFFTDDEKNMYAEMKFQKETIKFPLRIPCIQVTNDQWIGATDLKFIMNLRDAQLINYNVNAQRTMEIRQFRRVMAYAIALNRRSVKSIQKLFEDKIFIPNTITLNIPEDADVDYYYNKKEKELVIKSIDRFDISDGYHRYVAMGIIHDLDKKFNYPMEIRIINFSDQRVRQFIYQEDQKNKMSKIDSDSMNIQKASNIIVERLNQDTVNFQYQGCINRNEGQINFSELSALIHYFYIRDRKADNKRILEVMTKVRDAFNRLTYEDPSMIDYQFGYVALYIVVYCSTLPEEENPLSVGLIKNYINYYRHLPVDQGRHIMATHKPRTGQTNHIKAYIEWYKENKE